jgi:hypothetical protein
MDPLAPLPPDEFERMHELDHVGDVFHGLTRAELKKVIDTEVAKLAECLKLQNLIRALVLTDEAEDLLITVARGEDLHLLIARARPKDLRVSIVRPRICASSLEEFGVGAKPLLEAIHYLLEEPLCCGEPAGFRGTITVRVREVNGAKELWFDTTVSAGRLLARVGATLVCCAALVFLAGILLGWWCQRALKTSH